MYFYQLAVTVILLVPFCIAVWNYMAFAAIRRREQPREHPYVSVLIPARNEERTIERCVRSLLEQDYPNMEVLVLNDGSEDATATILGRLAAAYPALRVIEGTPLPAGWVGKNWACHQLAARSAGSWLVFTDADTYHHRESISACMAFAERLNVQFFSGVPDQQLPTFWEQVVVPMVMFLYFAYLPNRWITVRRDPQFSATNGQLLCVTRDGYEAIGGHEAVRSQLVEDVWLGRAAKRRGLRTALATAVETVECRMYNSFGEIVAGFSKNLFPGFDYSLLGLAFFIFSTLVLYLAPLAFVVAAATRGRFTVELFWLPLLHLAMAGMMRGMLAVRFRLRWQQILYHPLSAAMLSLIALNSARWTYSRRGTLWKGRSYGRGRK